MDNVLNAQAPTQTTATDQAPTTIEQNAAGEATKAANESLDSARLAALLKRERMIQDRERSIKERESKWKEREEIDALKDKDPIAWLEKHGLSYEKMTEHVLNTGSPESAMEAKIKALEEKVLGRERSEKEQLEKQQQDQYNKIVENHKSEIRNFIKQNSDKFELTATADNVDDVFSLIEAYWDKHQEVLPIEKAVEQVEEQYVAEFKKFLGLKKTRSLYDELSKSSGSSSSSTTTLTNKAASGASGAPDLQNMSDDEALKVIAAKYNIKI